MSPSAAISPAQARALWLRAQRLDEDAPFGAGPQAVGAATAHLGYVQIDTIHVIERSHHHILFTRIPEYRRSDLERAQSADRSVFEYWTHALAYVPTADYRMYMPAMKAYRDKPQRTGSEIDPKAYRALLARIRDEGALSIRDITDDVLVEKTHPWGSRKPSRAALRRGFFIGDLTISRRSGMLKTYELTDRHFGWPARPRPASADQFAHYLLQRGLQSQGLVSLDSLCHGNAACKPRVLARIERAVRRRELVEVHLAGHAKQRHWVTPQAMDEAPTALAPRVHLLSPFDPLVIQRRRLQTFFGYEHRFEAYVPPDKRVLGYFALPVLAGDAIVAALDLKMDRQADRLRVQRWTWLQRRAGLKAAIEQALERFERFQRGLAPRPTPTTP